MKNYSLILQEYAKKKKEIKNRLKDFKKVDGNKIFYELCFCLLTPQSKAENCDFVVSQLRRNNFINRNFNPKKYLRKKVRFHNKKSEYLMGMKLEYKELVKKLKCNDAKELRGWLVTNIKGIGYKEASHFLRNIGFENLAILDRHILKNLEKNSVISEIPKTITKNKYLKIEDSFLSFSKKIRIPMDEIDLLFWSLETGKIFK